MKRVILTTGGTGGHIFPALAVAEELRLRDKATQVLFVGGNYGPEGRLARSQGLDFRALPAKGVLGRGMRGLSSLVWVSRSLWKSRRLLKSFRPEVVAGFGGYAGFCPVLMAHWMNIPTAVHEQNSFPGTTNRVLGRKVDKVMVSFPDDHHSFEPGKVEVTGNPVRRSIRALGEKQPEIPAGRPGRLLVAGGSQGALAVNSAIIEALPEFKRLGIDIWHQTGEADFSRVDAAYLSLDMTGCRVSPFIEDMAEAYAWADLVICRAGATTIAEITVAGKPSILVPFPHATHDHQSVNANYLARQDAALVIPQDGLNAVGLAKVVEQVLTIPGRLAEMSAAARALGRPDAAATVVDNLEELARAS